MGRAKLEVAGHLVVLVEDAAIRPRKLDGVGDDGGEDGAEVERRGDDLSDLAKRLKLTD